MERDWLLRELKFAPLNASPLCLPQGHFFDGGVFGCLQTESAYNKKTQGKNLASAF